MPIGNLLCKLILAFNTIFLSENFSHFYRFMDKRMMLKLNGGRCVSGILRGFDPFMNVVIDETVEECRDGTKNNIGMVVSV